MQLHSCMGILLTLVILVGCQTTLTPQELMTEGQKSVHPLRQPLGIAAGCFARNIEKHRQVYVASVRDTPLGKEVAIRFVSHGGSHWTAVANIEPSGSGSLATVYLRNTYFYRRDEFIPTLVKDC